MADFFEAAAVGATDAGVGRGVRFPGLVDGEDLGDGGVEGGLGKRLGGLGAAVFHGRGCLFP